MDPKQLKKHLRLVTEMHDRAKSDPERQAIIVDKLLGILEMARRGEFEDFVFIGTHPHHDARHDELFFSWPPIVRMFKLIGGMELVKNWFLNHSGNTVRERKLPVSDPSPSSVTPPGTKYD